MKLGNISDIKRGVSLRFGHVYLDDNAIVSLADPEQRTVAVLHAGRRDFLWVVPMDNSQPFEIPVQGARREESDIPYGWSHAG